MSNSKQNDVGKATETIIADFLREKGYWAYILPKKVGGQPFDIVACRCNCVWMVDAKHLESEKASFSFDRIEPNQRTAMMYARTFANISNIGFVIYWERNTTQLYFLHYDKWQEMAKQGQKSAKIDDLEIFGDLLEI
jgi:hypothetical protein